jgi:hypothetical protein
MSATTTARPHAPTNTAEMILRIIMGAPSTR